MCFVQCASACASVTSVRRSVRVAQLNAENPKTHAQVSDENGREMGFPDAPLSDASESHPVKTVKAGLEKRTASTTTPRSERSCAYCMSSPSPP